MFSRPSMWAGDGSSFQVLAELLLDDLSYLDDRSEDYQAAKLQLKRYGERGLVGPFKAIFGEAGSYVSEVASVLAEVFCRLGYLPSVMPINDRSLDELAAQVSAFDGVDFRQSAIEAILGPPSFRAGHDTWCYVVAEPTAPWLFLDFGRDSVLQYQAGRGTYDDIEWKADPLLRDVRLPRSDFEAGLILTLYGKVHRWGTGWWIERPGSGAPAGVAEQLREIADRDPSHTLHIHQGRSGEWARLVAGAADLYVQADGGPRREREEAWSVLTQYLVGLARAERDWAAAERLQQAQVAVTRRLAADALVIPAPQCTLVQRNRIRTLSVSAHDLGEILRERGDPGCVEHYQEAMDLAAGIGDNIGESIAAFNLGTVYKDIPALRDLDQAEHWYQHCLDLVGDKAPIRRARSLNQLGTIALNRLNDAITAHQPVEINRHLTDAGRRYQEALRLFPPDDIADLAVTHSQLGTVYRHAGNIPRAFEHYQRSIKYEIAMGDRFSAGATRFNIALLFATHRAADALLYAQAALADYESYGGGAQQQAEQARALIAALEQT